MKLGKVVAGMALAGTAWLGASTAAVAHDGYKWGGAYIGASIGWFNADIDGTYVLPPADKHSGTQESGVIGGHFGLQHQHGKFVIGVEAAYSGTGLIGDQWASSLSAGSDCLGATPIANRTCQNRVTSFFTVGPRLGYTPADNLLLFVGGGYAQGFVQSRTRVTSTGAQLDYASDSTGGWYLGGGVEWALTKNWILGVEYQHIGLDDARLNTGAAIDNRRADYDIDIVRARLSFKLGRPEEHHESLK